MLPRRKGKGAMDTSPATQYRNKREPKKKGIVIAIGIVMLFALATSCYAEEEIYFEDSNITDDLAVWQPTSILTFQNPNGKEAIIDFGGDEVTYEGDMPVAESARMFFDAVFGIYKKEKR